MRMGKLSILSLAAFVLLASSVSISSQPIVIDGKDTTIALACIGSIDPDVIVQKLISLVEAIIKALQAPQFNYWDNVKDDVELVVGSYINNHSMSQVEHYQNDLETLLQRYANAPKFSTDFPNKDKQAAVLNVAIMGHRYLVMSGDMKYSLILHFQDIAAMHLAVLKDAAETYSTKDTYSRWYDDLNDQLTGYISYLNATHLELDNFRLGAVECTIKNGSCITLNAGESNRGVETCYDLYEIYDHVTGHKDTCKQLEGRSDCVNTCSDYKTHMVQQLDAFAAAKLRPVMESWQKLYAFTQTIVPETSEYHDIENKIKHNFY